MRDYSKRPNNGNHQIEREENDYEILSTGKKKRLTELEAVDRARKDVEEGKVIPIENMIADIKATLEKLERGEL